jgi:UPF0716 protein FxsA
MGLVFLVFPFLELFMIFKIGGVLGVANTLFWFVAAGILGFGVVKAQGRFLMTGFQASLAKGEIPANQALHSALIFFGGLALVVPGFLSDAVGILFILPGSRHLIALYLKKTLEKKLRAGSFKIFTMGNMGGFGTRPPEPPFRPGSPGDWRDVSPREIGGEVIDVDFTSTSSPAPNNPKDDDSN